MYTLTFTRKEGKTECYPYIISIRVWESCSKFLICDTNTKQSYIIPIDSIQTIVYDGDATPGS